VVAGANRLVGARPVSPDRGASPPRYPKSTDATPIPGPSGHNQGGFIGARDGSAQARLRNSLQMARVQTAPVSLGFGPDVDARVQDSPTLCAQLKFIAAHGYQIQTGPPNGGTYMLPHQKLIVIGQQTIPEFTTPEFIVNSLSHEVGHAVHHCNGFREDVSSLSGYIASNGIDEGVALLNEFKVAAELQSKNPNVFMAHREDEKSIYAQFLRDGDQIQAVIQLGATIYGKNVSAVGPNGEHKTYEDHWTQAYLQRVEPFFRDKAPAGKVGFPDTLELWRHAGPGQNYRLANLPPESRPESRP
jgi:hypothetical protein